jgi:hypothetical protein
MNLSQFFTPIWAAEAIVDRHFSRLNLADLVLEPSCGKGAFLKALPSHIPAIGVEIDPILADQTRRETGREIITGDFRAVPLNIQPTVILGNPPFQTDVIDSFFDRAHTLLPDGGRMGMLLPAYVFQTASRVARYTENWSIYNEMIPKNIFPRIRLPLVFAIFTKDKQRTLVGLSLYLETDDLNRMEKAYREAAKATGGSMWESVCRAALNNLGGKARLQDIYAEVEGKCPSTTNFWREKIRQTLRAYTKSFKPVSTGVYKLVTQ